MSTEKNETLFKEIDLLQKCIDKASNNSFVVKGWAITLLTVVLALFPEKVNYWFLAIIISGATVAFWYLDAFFLRVDKLYRWKYEWVIKNRPSNQQDLYNLDPYYEEMLGNDKDGKKRKVPRIIFVMFTPTLLAFYIPLLLISLGCLFYFHPSVGPIAQLL